MQLLEKKVKLINDFGPRKRVISKVRHITVKTDNGIDEFVLIKTEDGGYLSWKPF